MIGQWALILRGMSQKYIPQVTTNVLISQGGELDGEWVKGFGCANIQVNSTLLAATYALSTVLDTIVLLLSFIKLRILSKAVHTSALVTILFRDGLIYFIVAFVLSILGSNCIILTIFVP